MKSIDEMIAVMQSARDGKLIESAHSEEECGNLKYWVDDPSPTWSWANRDYRVKVVNPRKVTVVYGPDGSIESEFIELTPEIRAKIGL